MENSPTQAEQLKLILEEHDYQVVAAKNGREALALMNQRSPALATDVGTPLTVSELGRKCNVKS